MKTCIRFRCSFLFSLFTILLSACTLEVTTYDQPIPPLQSKTTTSSRPIASATHALPVAAATTLPPTESQSGNDPNPLPFLKPADSDMPAAGICGSGMGEIVQIALGTGPDGLPLAGRCVQVTPVQRIELVNRTLESFHVTFGMFDVEVPPGSIVLLDKPAGEYLAPGVHYLPNGPALWLKTADAALTATAPSPLRSYSNSAVGYALILPSRWNIDDFGATSTSKEVIFSPENAEPFVAYLSISLELRSMEQVTSVYAEHVPDAVRSDTVFNGLPAVQYTYSYGRIEYFIPYSGRIILVITDRPSNAEVQQILGSIRFMPS